MISLGNIALSLKDRLYVFKVRLQCLLCKLTKERVNNNYNNQLNYYYILLLAHLESAYSLIWGSHKIWGKGGGDTLDLL